MPDDLHPSRIPPDRVSPDRISLEGMRFFGFHGNNPEERELGQPFLVDLQAEVDTSAAGASDNLSDTVNYAAMYRAVRGVMEGPPRNLLEAVAEDIATAILSSFSVDAVSVRVRKPQPPIRDAQLASVGVEIYRSRQ